MSELAAVDLFAGIGGWAIACHHTGIRTLCFVEKDKRCQDFLSKAWPGIRIHGDINDFDAGQYRGADIVFAGVPCQPSSRAGKQGGEKDARWLWPKTLEVIGQIQPQCCLFENPPGIEDVGLDRILAQVEAQGYEIGPIFDIPACALNSPQLRHRYYLVAFAGSERRQQIARSPLENEGEYAWGAEDSDNKPSSDGESAMVDGERIGRQAESPERRTGRESAECGSGDLANSTGTRQDGTARQEQHLQRLPLRATRSSDGCEDMADAKSERPERRTDGPEQTQGGREERAASRLLPNPWCGYVWLPCADGKVRRAPGDSFGLVDGLHRSILGALGNAQVPQVAIEICKAIKSQFITARPSRL